MQSCAGEDQPITSLLLLLCLLCLVLWSHTCFRRVQGPPLHFKHTHELYRWFLFFIACRYPDRPSSQCHERLSPYFAGDDILEQFPPSHLMAGGFDPLLDDAVDFHTRLCRVGVSSSLDVCRSLPHGWCGLIDTVPSASRAFDRGVAFLAGCMA